MRKIIISGPIDQDGQDLMKVLKEQFTDIPVEFTKSELIKHEANQEDNDLKFMGMMNKSLREKRFEKAEEVYVKLERAGYDVTTENNGVKITIDTDSQGEKYGVIDFYPKANKLLIRKDNKWLKPASKWIHKNLL